MAALGYRLIASRQRSTHRLERLQPARLSILKEGEKVVRADLMVS